MAGLLEKITLLVTLCYVGGQPNGALRLVGLSSKFPASGRLEIYLNSQWGTVCGQYKSFFSQVTADVACKQLGFSTALSWGRVGNEGFIEGSGRVAIGSVKCSSSSASGLMGCDYSTNPSCSHYYDVALKCRHTGDRIRLVSWSGRSDNISAGRLEVFQNERWGTICNYDFNYNAATVACRQLGFSDYVEYGTTAGFTVPSASGNIPFVLSGLSCSSSESDLFSCPIHNVNYYTCTHPRNDVALSCHGTGALRLIDDSSSWSDKLPTGGRLEIYLNGKWGTIDSTGVGVNVASLACKQLGFNGYVQYGSVNSLGYSPASVATPAWLSGVSCYRDSYQHTILDCFSSVHKETSSGIYYHYSDLAVVCENPVPTTPVYHLDSRGPSIQILLLSLGSVCLCSCMLVVFSMVCMVCTRVKKRRSRMHVQQRNVVEETYDSPEYTDPFPSRPPPPPYSAVDIHAHVQTEQADSIWQEQYSQSSLQPVVNFSDSDDAEHEICYPTISVPSPVTSSGQPDLGNTGSSVGGSTDRTVDNSNDTEENADIVVDSCSENQRLLF